MRSVIPADPSVRTVPYNVRWATGFLSPQRTLPLLRKRGVYLLYIILGRLLSLPPGVGKQSQQSRGRQGQRGRFGRGLHLEDHRRHINEKAVG